MNQYELVVGLEVHIQLNTQSKMFCGCSNQAVDAPPNTLVCPVCFGMPGSLPVTNKEAVRKTLLLGKALGAELSEAWNFERKNYFYPDLPKGYQITSATNPPMKGGEMVVVDTENANATQGSLRIHHIHLEEDAGKLIHNQDGYSYVDLNRAGTPLIELVTEPDFRSSHQVKLFLQKMQAIARALNISEADMEHGHLRCDANVSVRKHGDKQLGTKVEIKNLNSFSMVEQAITHEFARQSDLLVNNGQVNQETRSWDEKGLKTVALRSKEEVQDYRYFPEPDLPPIMRLEVAEFTDDALHKDLSQVELPAARIEKLKQRGITGKLADELSDDDSIYRLVSHACELLQNPSDCLALATFIRDPIVRFASEHNVSFANIALSPEQIVKILADINDGRMTHQLFKSKLPLLLQGSITFEQLEQDAAESAQIDISSIVKEVVKEHASVVADWKSGNEKVYGFLVGQVMARSKGQADPQKVNHELKTILNNLK